MIKYTLRENLLTAEPDDYAAQVVDTQSYTLDDIIDRMMRRGTTVTRTDAAALMQLYGEECSAIIKEGGSLNTPLLNTSFSISGVFNGAGDGFDKSRHTVKINVTAGTALKDAAADAKVQKVEGANTDPYIVSVADKLTGSTDEVSGGSVMEITGARLKFDAKDAEQGVFCVKDGNDIRCASYIEVKPARIIALFPTNFPAGDFALEVRTKIDGTKKLKTLKKGVYRKILTAV